MCVCTCSHSLGTKNYYGGKGARGGFKLGAHSQIFEIMGSQCPGERQMGGYRSKAGGHQRTPQTAAETEGEEKGKVPHCSAQHFGCLLEVSVVGRMMVVANRVFK